MSRLSTIGRIFYSIAIAGMGFLAIYNRDFPYVLTVPAHFRMNDHLLLINISGALLILAGACIAWWKEAMPISLLLGSALLLLFCFYYIPYELLVSPNYMHFSDWENAVKELALASGAFVIAGCYSKESKGRFIGFLRKLMPFGAIVFSLTIISFGMNHFLYAKGAAEYIPSWVSNHMFWIYLAGFALIGSGIGIILNIRSRLMAALLGIMIFIWIIILHIPNAIAATLADKYGEVTSAFLALAYCGIAFVIAGRTKLR